MTFTMTLAEAQTRFSYDPDSGSLTWLPKAEDSRYAIQWNKRFAGTVAGALNGEGYLRIGVGGTNVVAHRIAWLFIYGVWPDHQIDHRDRNRANNSEGNLRASTQGLNCANASLARNNTSGFKGVSWHSRKGRWSANIRVNRKLYNLGYFDKAEDASRAYLEAASKAFGEFATNGAAA